MADVNYIGHVSSFFQMIAEDERITPWHVSLYFALFQIWNNTRFKEEINIRREELMELSKIGSANTYTRCLKELNDWGYIMYAPSKSRFKSSKVHMYRFDTTPDTSADKSTDTSCDTSCDTSPDNSSVHLVRPFLNNTKHIENNNKQSKTLERGESNSPTPPKPKNDENLFFSEVSDKSQKLSVTTNSEMPKPKSKKTKSTVSNKSTFKPPSLQETKDFFSEHKSSFQQAEKFFNHFESNGWKVGGKAPMKNWKAAARNWMIRAEEYQLSKMSPAQQRLHVTQQKDYSEPL